MKPASRRNADVSVRLTRVNPAANGQERPRASGSGTCFVVAAAAARGKTGKMRHFGTLKAGARATPDRRAEGVAK
jgi:hypothetical protein